MAVPSGLFDPLRFASERNAVEALTDEAILDALFAGNGVIRVPWESALFRGKFYARLHLAITIERDAEKWRLHKQLLREIFS